MKVRKVCRRAYLPSAGVSMLLLLFSSTASAVPDSIVHSTSFAGYTASITTAVPTVTGTLTVPTVTCPASGYADVSSGVFLRGTGSMFSEVFILCYNGAMEQAPLLEVSVNGGSGSNGGSSGTVFVSPGDMLSFSLTDNTTSKTLVGVVKDKTTGYSASATAPGTIEPVPGTPLNVQAGTTVTGNGTGSTVVPAFTPGFTIGVLKLGTSTLSAFSPTESEMFNGTTLQISTSKILTGGSFTNTFVHS
jgi:hypothetical protein